MRKITFFTDGQAELDGNPLSFTKGMELILVPAQEIVEEGVASIELAASSTFNRSYTPAAGRVKWFRDELGQLWAKFSTTKRDLVGTVVDHVWPADRVVEVQYNKERS
jgi:hypothetical protein